MVKIAHIINPVIVSPSSDLYLAQPITFESMKIAKEQAKKSADISLLSAQFSEDSKIVPSYFTKTPNLERSILDIHSNKSKKLPFIKDILDRLVNTSVAEYLIYSNVDIAVKPEFYIEILNILEEGYDAFVINRRTISSRFNDVSQLPQMYKESGKKHPGYDCFVFKKSIYHHFKLGRMIIGANRIGMAIVTNLISYSRKTKIFEDKYLTFHIGEERVWKQSLFDDYSTHNFHEYISISKNIQKEIGRLTKYYRHFRILRFRKFLKELKYL
jgi:hypothetical protein